MRANLRRRGTFRPVAAGRRDRSLGLGRSVSRETRSMVTGRPGSAGSGIGVRESWRAWMPACVTAGDVNASRVIAWVRERPGARCGDAGREAVVHGSVKRMTESSTADHWMKPLLHDGDPLSPGTFGPSMFFLDPGSFNVASPSADSTPHPAALRFRDPDRTEGRACASIHCERADRHSARATHRRRHPRKGRSMYCEEVERIAQLFVKVAE